MLFVTLYQKTSGLNNNTKKIVNLLIKLIVVALAGIFIYRKLNNNADLKNFEQILKNLPPLTVYGVLVLVVLLMFVNWFLEAAKWKFLIKKIQPISNWRAIESVFCGLTLAVFTPNRIGEYGGRVFFLAPRKRVLGVIAMGIGAVGQMVITNLFGAVAILWFIYYHAGLNVWVFYLIAFLASVFCIFFLLLYFNINVLLKLLSTVRLLKRFKKFFSILSRYGTKELLIVFTYSLLRYVVFTSQYCLVITLLIPDIAFGSMIMMILILFFIQSALPSLDLVDVGVRTMTATYFFSFITSNDIAIMASTASIWLINLIIPAILGSIFVFKLNFFGTSRN